METNTVGILDQYVGISGHTSDEEFGNVVEALERFAQLVDEDEVQRGSSEVIISTYRDIHINNLYKLWYLVRTPDSPEGVEFPFGFERA